MNDRKFPILLHIYREIRHELHYPSLALILVQESIRDNQGSVVGVLRSLSVLHIALYDKKGSEWF